MAKKNRTSSSSLVSRATRAELEARSLAALEQHNLDAAEPQARENAQVAGSSREFTRSTGGTSVTLNDESVRASKGSSRHETAPRDGRQGQPEQDLYGRAGDLLKAGVNGALDRAAAAIAPREDTNTQSLQANVALEQIAGGSLSKGELESVQATGSAEQVAYATNALEKSSAEGGGGFGVGLRGSGLGSSEEAFQSRAHSETHSNSSDRGNSVDMSHSHAQSDTRARASVVADAQGESRNEGFSAAQVESWSRGEGATAVQQEAAQRVRDAQGRGAEASSAGISSSFSNSVSDGSRVSFGVGESVANGVGLGTSGQASQSRAYGDSHSSGGDLSAGMSLSDVHSASMARATVALEATGQMRNEGFSATQGETRSQGETATSSQQEGVQLALGAVGRGVGMSDSHSTSSWGYQTVMNAESDVQASVANIGATAAAAEHMAKQGLGRTELLQLAEGNNASPAQQQAAQLILARTDEQPEPTAGSVLTSGDGSAVRSGDGSVVSTGAASSPAQGVASDLAVLQAAFVAEAKAFSNVEAHRDAVALVPEVREAQTRSSEDFAFRVEHAASTLKELAQSESDSVPAESKALFAMAAAALERGDLEGAQSVRAAMTQAEARAQDALGDAMVASAEARSRLPFEMQLAFGPSPAHVLANDGTSGHYREDATAFGVVGLREQLADSRSSEALSQHANEILAQTLAQGTLASRSADERRELVEHFQALADGTKEPVLARYLNEVAQAIDVGDDKQLRQLAGELSSLELAVSEEVRKQQTVLDDTVASLPEHEALMLAEHDSFMQHREIRDLLASPDAEPQLRYEAAVLLTDTLASNEPSANKLEALEGLREGANLLADQILSGESSPEHHALANALAVELPPTEALRNALVSVYDDSTLEVAGGVELLQPAEREAMAQDLVRQAQDLQHELPGEAAQGAVSALYGVAEALTRDNGSDFLAARDEAREALSGLVDSASLDAHQQLAPRMAALEHNAFFARDSSLSDTLKGYSALDTEQADFGLVEASASGISVANYVRKDMAEELPHDLAREASHKQMEEDRRERLEEDMSPAAEMEMDAD